MLGKILSAIWVLRKRQGTAPKPLQYLYCKYCDCYYPENECSHDGCDRCNKLNEEYKE